MMQPQPSQIVRQCDPVARIFGGGAMMIAMLALVFAMSGLGQAAPQTGERAAAKAKQSPKGKRKKGLPPVTLKPRPYALLRLNAKKRFPAAAIPKVAAARNADKIGGKAAKDLILSCPSTTVDLGTWCLDSSTYPIDTKDIGKNDFLFATKACVAAGGYLPSAAQLIGAADRVKLASTIDDNETTAAIDFDPTNGLRDQREMSSTLFTVTSGSNAGGSQGVTAGSLGDPRQGEPNPVTAPRDPLPETLNYTTVYDNGNLGGFAGGAPVGAPEKFRCAYAKAQGVAATED